MAEITDEMRNRLGRIPSPPDERDFKLADFQADDDELLAQAIDELKQTTVGYSYFLKKEVDPPKSSHWFKAMALLSQIGQQPIPPLPSQDIVWNLTSQLDQGDTPHCVGFGWAGWHNSEPVLGSYVNNDGHVIYYEIKVIEGEPGEENGAWVRSGGKAMQNRKRLDVYAFADTIDEVKTYLRAKGPVVMGTDWYSNMFDPNSQGYVYPTGSIEGGHCWLIIGDLVSEDAFLCENSWGNNWGLNGRFKIEYSDFTQLLNDQGEAVASLELA